MLPFSRCPTKQGNSKPPSPRPLQAVLFSSRIGTAAPFGACHESSPPKLDPLRRRGGVPCKRRGRRPPARAHQNVVPIDKLPRHIRGLPEAQLSAWIQEATQLTIHQLVTRPSL